MNTTERGGATAFSASQQQNVRRKCSGHDQMLLPIWPKNAILFSSTSWWFVNRIDDDSDIRASCAGKLILFDWIAGSHTSYLQSVSLQCTRLQRFVWAHPRSPTVHCGDGYLCVQVAAFSDLSLSSEINNSAHLLFCVIYGWRSVLRKWDTRGQCTMRIKYKMSLAKPITCTAGNNTTECWGQRNVMFISLLGVIELTNWHNL